MQASVAIAIASVCVVRATGAGPRTASCRPTSATRARWAQAKMMNRSRSYLDGLDEAGGSGGAVAPMRASHARLVSSSASTRMGRPMKYAPGRRAASGDVYIERY